MRDLGVCVHEAGHLIAMYYLGGRIATSLKWEEDGGAAVGGLLKDLHPMDRFVIAAMGHTAAAVADQVFSADLSKGRGPSTEDQKMMEDALYDLAGNSIYIYQLPIARRAWSNAAAFAHQHLKAIMTLALHLHEKGTIPDRMMLPEILQIRDLKAEIAKLQEQAEAEQRQEQDAPSEEEVEQLLEHVDDLVRQHEKQEQARPHDASRQLQPASSRPDGRHGIEYKVETPERPHMFNPDDYAGIKWLDVTGKPL